MLPEDAAVISGYNTRPNHTRSTFKVHIFLRFTKWCQGRAKP